MSGVAFTVHGPRRDVAVAYPIRSCVAAPTVPDAFRNITNIEPRWTMSEGWKMSPEHHPAPLAMSAPWRTQVIAPTMLDVVATQTAVGDDSYPGAPPMPM